MKKKYMKPELFFESFELSQQIAACNFDLVENSLADEQCKFKGNDADWGEVTILMISCGYEEGGAWTEDYCYHNSTTGWYGIFNS